MEYPTDQAELKKLLLADEELAFKWFDANCVVFIKCFFKAFKCNPIIKSRIDIEDIIQECRLKWFMDVLGKYDHMKINCLKTWSNFCNRRWIITYFKCQGFNNKFHNKFLTICDLTTSNDDNNRTDWLEVHVSEEYKKEQEHDIYLTKVEQVLQDLFPVLSEKEKHLLENIIGLYEKDPYKFGVHGMLNKLAKRMRIKPKVIDNGLQRIRRKIKEKGIS